MTRIIATAATLPTAQQHMSANGSHPERWAAQRLSSADRKERVSLPELGMFLPS